MPMQRRVVLAVADAAERAALLSRLNQCGFRTDALDHASRIAAALAAADALVLDASLVAPETPALCAALRRDGFAQPIIVLHDGDDHALMVRSLDAGANDGVVRPVRALELGARLRAHMRTLGGAAETVLEIGPYHFRPDLRELEEAETGRVIRLTATETAMLRFLHRAGGVPVPRPVLLHEVWGYRDGVATHTVETHIYRLRRKIEPDPGRRRLLLSEDAGYRLNLAWNRTPRDISDRELRATG